MVRRGFTLVELIVALTLLSVGALALAAGGSWAARLSSEAVLLERSAGHAESLLDSLRRAGSPGEGALVEPGLSLRWVLASGRPLATLTIAIRVGAHREVLEAHHAPLPPPLPGAAAGSTPEP